MREWRKTGSFDAATRIKLWALRREGELLAQIERVQVVKLHEAWNLTARHANTSQKKPACRAVKPRRRTLFAGIGRVDG
jgi:hypothetical protein